MTGDEEVAEVVKVLSDADPELYDTELYRPVTAEEISNREFKDEEKQVAIQAFAAGMTLGQTAQLLCTSEEHLREQLGTAMESGKQRQVMKMAQLALREAQCDSSMLRWWLERHGGENFQPKPTVAVNNQTYVEVKVK